MPNEIDQAGPPAGRSEALAAAVTAVLARQLAAPLPAGLYLVATPIGNLADITLRALSVLAAADLVLAEDTRHSRRLLQHYAIDRPLRALHDHNETHEIEWIAARIAGGAAVALISDAGTPLISDPGFKLVRELAGRQLPLVPIPGPSALTAALSVAGLPSDTATFGGFLPVKSGARRTRIAELARAPGTLILFEAANRLADSLAALADGLGGGRPAVIARELTKHFEEFRRGSLDELTAEAAERDIKGEIVLLIGGAAPTAPEQKLIESALTEQLKYATLRDAVTSVAATFALPRKEIYRLAVTLRDSTATGDDTDDDGD